jgi:hypothetical protein
MKELSNVNGPGRSRQPHTAFGTTDGVIGLVQPIDGGSPVAASNPPREDRKSGNILVRNKDVQYQSSGGFDEINSYTHELLNRRLPVPGMEDERPQVLAALICTSSSFLISGRTLLRAVSADSMLLCGPQCLQ